MKYFIIYKFDCGGINNIKRGERGHKVNKVLPKDYLSELLHVNYDVQL